MESWLEMDMRRQHRIYVDRAWVRFWEYCAGFVVLAAIVFLVFEILPLVA